MDAASAVAPPAIAAVICAAGASSRMGGVKKEYQKLDNSADSPTVLGAAVSAFAKVSSVEFIVITIPENGEAAARDALPPELLSAEGSKLFFVTGGQCRRASVFNALSFLAAYSPRYVLIHDGARPWITPSLIRNIIEAVKKYDAVIPLLPISDTPKECDAPLWSEEPPAEVQAAEGGVIQPFSLHSPTVGRLVQTVFIKRHLKRANTGIAQTPQAFAFPAILHAHEKAAALANEEFTDDAEVWGRFCGPVAVIPGLRENRKITFPADMGRK